MDETSKRFAPLTRDDVIQYALELEERLQARDRALIDANNRLMRLIGEKYALKAQLPKPKREARRPIPEHKKQEVLELGRTTGLCVREIAERTGVSPTSVYRLLRVSRGLGTDRAAGD